MSDEESLLSRPSGRIKRNRRILGAVAAVVVAASVTAAVLTMSGSPEEPPLPDKPLERARALMKRTPLIDGHNDLAFEFRKIARLIQ